MSLVLIPDKLGAISITTVHVSMYVEKHFFLCFKCHFFKEIYNFQKINPPIPPPTNPHPLHSRLPRPIARNHKVTCVFHSTSGKCSSCVKLAGQNKTHTEPLPVLRTNSLKPLRPLKTDLEPTTTILIEIATR